MDCFASLAMTKKRENNKMARLPYLEADQVAPEYRDMLKRNTNLHKLLVNSPDMARAFNGIGGYIRFKSKLDRTRHPSGRLDGEVGI
jgi:hypothetical protein